jgi:hypothetical protein
LTVDKQKVKAATFNTTPDDVAERMIARFCPEPAASFHWPMRVTAERFGTLPRLYVETLRDRAIPIELQRMMQQRLPCRTVITMDTDHAAAASGPQELGAHLSAMAEYIP